MNFKIIKKNYKKIIIVCLIMLILSYKISENFTTTQALDAVKSTEKKVNDVYSKVDKDRVTIKKQLHMDNILSLEAKQIRLKNAGDANHVIFYNKDIDGPEIKGWNGISLATGTGGAKRVVEIRKDYMKVNGKICINGTCLDENALKHLNMRANPPKRRGCYMYSPSHCENGDGWGRGREIRGQWFFDTHKGAHTSDSKCKQRVKDYNSWCKVKDFKYKFNKGY